MNSFSKEKLTDLRNFLVVKRDIDLFCSNVLVKTTVRAGNRITLPSYVMKQYELGSEVVVQGAINHLNIFKNLEKQRQFSLKRNKKG